MKPKSIVTAVLLVFVALSVVVFIAKESLEPEAAAEAGGQTEAAAAPANPGDAASPVETAAASASIEDRKFVVSYLHGTARCYTCRVLQENATEAMNTHFASELADGSMEFRVVNMATPENSHLPGHYEIYSQSLIVSELHGGEEVRWKNLDRIWNLVRDKAAYLEYVRSEVEAFRRGS